jgi:acetylornithine deacetylase
VDPLDLVGLSRTLIDIDSTTGREGDCGRWLAAYLRYLGWAVDEQPVSDGRINVIAALDAPAVVYSTHFDCVPPFIPSSVDGSRLYGRGSCDAKGILAAQVMAAERLRSSGERRVGMVFVVGEERGSDGARAANQHPLAPGCQYLINGEPTDSRLASATRGILRVALTATGRAAHSSRPDLGESAIDKLIDALIRLRGETLPDDPVLGRTHYSIGLIAGGVAPNVISPHAEAEVMFRTVGSNDDLAPAIERLHELVETRHVLEVPAVHLRTLDGFETASFPFTTDIPFLDRWGEPLLVGPGSVLVAHTDDEHVEIAELERAVDTYESLARSLLNTAGPRDPPGHRR